jgi:hypothetical protein
MTTPLRVMCSRCARSRADESAAQALAWVLEKDQDRQNWLCPTCARTHVRDIEGKLPAEYW